MTPTRADLERRIETWRKEAKQLRAMAEAELHNLDFRDEWDNRARELDRCADQLAALLTSEGPAPTPIHCTTVELNGTPVAAPCAIEGRCMYPYPAPAQRPETPTVGTWQPIETFKPGEHRSVLVYADGRVGEARYLREDDEWWWMSERQGEYWDSPIKVVTHWMPLPDAPKEPTPA